MAQSPQSGEDGASLLIVLTKQGATTIHEDSGSAVYEISSSSLKLKQSHMLSARLPQEATLTIRPHMPSFSQIQWAYKKWI